MSSPEDQLAIVRDLRARNGELEQLVRSLNEGGGDGTYGGMEPRVTKLEEHVGNIRVDVGVIKTELGHKPGKGFIVTASLAIIGFLTTVIAFSDKIHTLLK